MLPSFGVFVYNACLFSKFLAKSILNACLFSKFLAKSILNAMDIGLPNSTPLGANFMPLSLLP
jgi:hypothetical protein